jgi:cation diffusion facilitator CzcD-associated flavoprotein CzcO
VSLDLQKREGSLPTAHYDVVVMGAGPYGLAAAAHLLGRGLKVAVFGKPLKLWCENMPQGMLLRSYWWATNISDPLKKYDLEHYFKAEGKRPGDPFQIETFIDYGMWFQKHAVPDVDETYIDVIERKGQEYELRLVDGRVVKSQSVVMAPGLAYYVFRAPEFDHMPVELVSHTSDHFTFEGFSGKRVAVVGGGQSALETAALVHESGAHVDLITRSPIHWLSGDSLKNRSLINQIKYPKAGIAPGWVNWGFEHLPYAFQRLSRDKKDRLLRGRGRFGPAGAGWLKDRILGKVTVHELQHVQEIKEIDGEVELTLSSNETLRVDHVILGTGFVMDIKRLPMLHSSLLDNIETYQGAPILNKGFGTNIPGLYFIGFSSVSSFGPLFRFVVGTDAAARRVAGAVARQVAHAR